MGIHWFLFYLRWHSRHALVCFWCNFFHCHTQFSVLTSVTITVQFAESANARIEPFIMGTSFPKFVGVDDDTRYCPVVVATGTSLNPSHNLPFAQQPSISNLSADLPDVSGSVAVAPVAVDVATRRVPASAPKVTVYLVVDAWYLGFRDSCSHWPLNAMSFVFGWKPDMPNSNAASITNTPKMGTDF